MDAKDFQELAKILGIPGAMLIVFFILNYKGYIVFGRELLKQNIWAEMLIKFKDAVIDEKKQDLLKQEHDFLARLESMKKEKNFWRQIALGGQEELERATRTVEKVVEKIPRNPASLPPDGE